LEPIAMSHIAKTQRSWTDAALWSRGFRPFFLAAALWAVAAVAIWPPFFTGAIAIPTAFAPIDWHVHEMIYGYGAAVVAGFLLTAIPNWTGRLPVAGWPLALLAGLWALGRIAVFVSAEIGWAPAALLDTAFLIAFALLIGREVIAGDNRRNLKVVVLVLMFAAANVGFHIEALTTGSASISARAGLAIIVFLILLIGGRVVPSFTHNWLAKQGTTTRPAPFGRFDGAVIMLSALALVAWIAAPEKSWTGAALLAAGIANLWRLARWRSWTTLSDRLVLVLHAGFLFAALGFLFAGVHALWPDLVASPAAGVHVWAVGGVGTMTLAMMTRATLGHTGHDLVASRATQFVYLGVVVAMLARVMMEFLPALMLPLLYGAAASWVIAFAGFAFVYGPMLTRRAGPRN
jgi:uncharacterized protein involved in response to NO